LMEMKNQTFMADGMSDLEITFDCCFDSLNIDTREHIADFTEFVKDECGESRYSTFFNNLFVFLAVHLEEPGTVTVLVCPASKMRCHSLAGCAPRCIEINNDQLVSSSSQMLAKLFCRMNVRDLTLRRSDVS